MDEITRPSLDRNPLVKVKSGVCTDLLKGTLAWFSLFSLQNSACLSHRHSTRNTGSTKSSKCQSAPWIQHVWQHVVSRDIEAWYWFRVCLMVPTAVWSPHFYIIIFGFYGRHRLERLYMHYLLFFSVPQGTFNALLPCSAPGAEPCTNLPLTYNRIIKTPRCAALAWSHDRKRSDSCDCHILYFSARGRL